MLKNDISAIEEQFNQECTVIELKYEYPGYTGIEKYAIVSSLSQKEIETRFPEQARSYSPCLVLDISFLDVRRDYRNNNKKYEMRSIRSESVFGFNDSDTETHHKEIYVPDFVEQWIENYELKEAIKQLTDKERDRLIDYFYNDKTLTEIGDKVACSPRAVKYSIDSAIKKIQTFFDSLLQK